MDNPKPPKTSEEAIALWRQRRKQRQAGAKLSQAPTVIGSAIDNQVTLSGRLMRTAGSGGTVMVELDKPYKGLKQIPATAIDGCTTHGKVALMKAEGGGWGAIGRGTEQLIQEREVSRDLPRQSDRYKKIKYLYSVVSKKSENPEEIPDERAFYVGGHQPDPVLVEGLTGAEFRFSPIDNLGGADFSINAIRDQSMEFWLGTEKQWSAKPASNYLNFVCRGNGFWSLDYLAGFESSESPPGSNPRTTVTNRFKKNGFIFEGKSQISQYTEQTEVYVIGSTEDPGDYFSQFVQGSTFCWMLPSVLSKTGEISVSGSGYRKPESQYLRVFTDVYSLSPAIFPISPSRRSTVAVRLISISVGTNDPGEDRSIQKREALWIQDGKVTAYDSDAALRSLGAVSGITDEGFHQIDLLVTIDDPDSTTNPPQKITINAIAKAIKFQESTAIATVTEFSSEFQELQTVDVDFYLPHVTEGFIVHGYSYNAQD